MVLCGVWRGSLDGGNLSAGADLSHRGSRARVVGLFPCAKPIRDRQKGVKCMKIVVVRSPKLFRGILRRMFGIRREDYIE
jgi:hypothetical protein